MTENNKQIEVLATYLGLLLYAYAGSNARYKFEDDFNWAKKHDKGELND